MIVNLTPSDEGTDRRFLMRRSRTLQQALDTLSLARELLPGMSHRPGVLGQTLRDADLLERANSSLTVECLPPPVPRLDVAGRPLVPVDLVRADREVVRMLSEPGQMTRSLDPIPSGLLGRVDTQQLRLWGVVTKVVPMPQQVDGHGLRHGFILPDPR